MTSDAQLRLIVSRMLTPREIEELQKDKRDTLAELRRLRMERNERRQQWSRAAADLWSDGPSFGA